jgi:hypothetical protein
MEANGWRELIEYGSCAVGMFMAFNAAMAVNASLQCARLFVAESW